MQTQDNRTWTPAQRPYVPCLPTTHTYRYMCMYGGLFPTSEVHTEVQMRSRNLMWAKTRLAGEAINLQAIFKDFWSSNKCEFTMPSQSSPPTLRQYLMVMVKRRGHYCRRKASPVSLISRITIICKHYSSSPRNCPFWPGYDLRIDGIPALIAPSTRRIVKGILPIDERVGREGCREGYSIWGCICRGPFSARRIAER